MEGYEEGGLSLAGWRFWRGLLGAGRRRSWVHRGATKAPYGARMRGVGVRFVARYRWRGRRWAS